MKKLTVLDSRKKSIFQQKFTGGGLRTNHPDEHFSIDNYHMKLHAKEPFTQGWLLSLLTGLMLVALPALSSAISIGQEYDGGVVCYLDASKKHGLVAARSDMKGHSPECQEGFFTWKDAQAACRNYVSCDYHDWVLPTKEQLNKLYLHKNDLESYPFTCDYYWSSTEIDASKVWVQGFGAGFQVQNFKTNGNRVRAVRPF